MIEKGETYEEFEKTAIVLIALSSIPLLFFVFTELKFYFTGDYLETNIGGVIGLGPGLLLLSGGDTGLSLSIG